MHWSLEGLCGAKHALDLHCDRRRAARILQSQQPKVAFTGKATDENLIDTWQIYETWEECLVLGFQNLGWLSKSFGGRLPGLQELSVQEFR